MAKTKTQEEWPYYIYRENKGYFYGPGAGPVLYGLPVNWKLDSAESAKESSK